MSRTRLDTFKAGLANDWIGSAHAASVTGTTVTDGQLVLSTNGVTSGQTSTVQYARLPADVVPASGDVTIEAWSTRSDSANWARRFDIGTQLFEDTDGD